MITIKEAYSIVKRNNPDMRAFTAIEQKEAYVFSLIPKDLKSDDGFANSAVYTINKKTKGYKILPFMEVLGKHIVNEFDVTDLE